MHEDHKAPIVAVNVWYDVGAVDEAPGKTAYARACRSSASTHRSKSGIQADQRFPHVAFDQHLVRLPRQVARREVVQPTPEREARRRTTRGR